MLTREQLYPYQGKASAFVKANPFCALWKDMGLGKTVSALTAGLDLIQSFEVRKILVIAPVRVARKVWSDEIKRWAHLQGLTISCCVAGEQQMTGMEADWRRRDLLKVGADITTINREQMQWLESLYIQGKRQIRHWPWDMVIVDESQSFKSQSSYRWKSLNRLRRLCSRFVELTGTPAPNGYADLWSQLYLLDRGKRLGESESAFQERWFDPPSYESYGWTLKEGYAAREIQDAVSDIVLTMRAEDYLALPPIVYNTIKIQMPDAARVKYKRLAKAYMYETYSGKVVTAVNAAVCRGKLLQLANGAIYVDSKRNYEVLHDAKIEALLETLEGLPAPVMIGYGFDSDVKRLAAPLEKFCGKTKTWRILSSDADFDAFRKGEIDYAVLHPASAGHGLNDLHLSGSEQLVWFGLTNNLEFYQQLNARLTGGHRRMGKNVVIHHLIMEDTADEDTLELLTRKDATQDALTRRMADIARGTLR